MSTFSLTRGSEAALGMLASQAGCETLLLTQPARELRAELSIEPFTSDSGDQLLAVLFMREQRHSMTLQRNDGANVQHLADWIVAVANGTLDTAEAIPQRADPSDLAAATAAFNAAAHELNAKSDPAPAQDERETFEQAFVIQEGVYWSEDHQSYRSMNGRAIEDRDAIDATMWWAGWKARAALARPAQTEQQPAYVECRECTDCGHVGINDAHPTDATCAMCDWSGPSPVEDQCPDCGKENAMGAACPKCSGRYRILAETHVAAPIAQTAPQPEQSRIADRLNSVIAELKGGFVACQRCGDQEDTATLDCVPELEAIAAGLATSPTA